MQIRDLAPASPYNPSSPGESGLYQIRLLIGGAALSAIVAVAACDTSRSPTTPQNVSAQSDFAAAVTSISSRPLSWSCVSAPTQFRPGTCPSNALILLGFDNAIAAPAAPASLAGSVSGNRVSLTWLAPSAGDVAT